MGKRKGLGDLYKTCEPVTFSDGATTVQVQVVKLNDVDKEEAVTAAIAAKARVMAQAANPDSDMYVETLFAAQAMDFESIVDILVMEELEQKIVSIREELVAEKPWSEDDYILGLEEAWTGNEGVEGLGAQWDRLEAAGKPIPDDLVQVRAQLDKFNEVLAQRVREAKEDAADAFAGMEPEYLHDRVAKRIIALRADQAFTDEWLRQRTFRSTREIDDRLAYHFASMAAYIDADKRVKVRLMHAYDEMSVDGIEGKGSPGTPGSSQQSEQPDTAGPTTDSGPEAASASRTSPPSS